MTFTAVWGAGQGYKVSFKCGSSPAVEDYLPSPVIMPTASSFNGKVFDGWNDGSGSGYKTGEAVTITKNTTFTAKYVNTLNEVPFLYFNGTSFQTVAVKTTTENSRSIVTPSAPAKEGYTFKGWTRDFVTFTGAGASVDSKNNDKPFYAVYNHSQHNYETHVISGDCTTAEITYKICACGAMQTTKKDDYVQIWQVSGPVVGHKFGNYVLSGDGTHQTRECSVCHLTETKKVVTISNTLNLFAIGDSITFGQKVSGNRENSYARFVADRLGLNYVNEAISGTRLCTWRSVLTQSNNHNQYTDTSVQGLGYETIVNNINNAGVVIMTLSTNDVFYGADASDIETRMYEFIDEIHRRNPEAIVILANGAFGVAFWENAVSRFGIASEYSKYDQWSSIELNKRYAKGFSQPKYDFVYYVDISSVISDYNSFTGCTGNPDGVHPGSGGYAEMVDMIMASLGNVKTGTPVTTYKVTFKNSNGATVSTLNANGLVTLPDAPTAPSDDYAFKGWSPDGGITLYGAGSKLNVNKEMTLTAVFVYSLAKSELKNISDNTVLEQALLNFPDGYTVSGNVCTFLRQDRFKYSAEKNVVFDGVKTLKITSVTDTNTSAWSAGECLNLPTFAGLSAEDMQYIKIKYYYDGGSVNNAGIKWTLKFTVGGETLSVESDEVAVEDKWATMTFNLANCGKDFGNYFGKNVTKLTLAFYEGHTIKDKANASYYFADITASNRSGEVSPTPATKYTVTVINDAQQISSEQIDAGSSFTLPSNTKTKTGYTFEGWSDGCAVYEEGAKYTVASDVTFTAVWTMDTPTSSTLYGDVNGNGSVTLADLTRLKAYFANYDSKTGTSTVEIKDGADVNGNGSVTLADLTRLKSYFANYDSKTGTSTTVLGPQ